MRYRAAVAQVSAHESDLAFQQIDIGRYGAIFAHHGSMAPTVKTELSTKRHV